MGKMQADELKKIRVSDLRKFGFLSGSTYHSGTMTWTNRWDEKSNISVVVWTTPDKPLLRISYSITKRDTGEKKDYMYDIPLTTTPCQYGGMRWWFTCPMLRSGMHCGRRVTTIYLGDALFACRHCYNLTYASCNASERYKGFVSIPDLEMQEAKITRTHYKGKPTRKYRKLLKMQEKFDYGFVRMVGTKLLKKYASRV